MWLFLLPSINRKKKKKSERNKLTWTISRMPDYEKWERIFSFWSNEKKIVSENNRNSIVLYQACCSYLDLITTRISSFNLKYIVIRKSIMISDGMKRRILFLQKYMFDGKKREFWTSIKRKFPVFCESIQSIALFPSFGIFIPTNHFWFNQEKIFPSCPSRLDTAAME